MKRIIVIDSSVPFVGKNTEYGLDGLYIGKGHASGVFGNFNFFRSPDGEIFIVVLRDKLYVPYSCCEIV